MHACAMMIDDDRINAMTAWLADAALAGEPETALVHGFCERAIAAGLPIGRAIMFIDTLHPVHEGRLFRWGHDPSEPLVQEYGRTGPASAPATDPDVNER
jgi:adenylate cyclase